MNTQNPKQFSRRDFVLGLIVAIIAAIIGGVIISHISSANEDRARPTPINTVEIARDGQPDTVEVAPTATSCPYTAQVAPTATLLAQAQNVGSNASSTERTAIEAPYDLPPQPYVSHPSLYLETGIEKTQTWQIELLPGTVAIVGGYEVDNESGGVYKALSGGLIETTVTDGFVSVVDKKWAREEFCFRVGEAERYGWAHAHLHPLPDWGPNPCS